jgi:hypothetical protein
MVSPSASVLPESLAMGHKCATDAGREDTGAPHTFLETKNAWDCSWRPILLTIAANLCDNAGFFGDARLIK